MLDPCMLRDHRDEVRNRLELRGVSLQSELDVLERLEEELGALLSTARRGLDELKSGG